MLYGNKTTLDLMLCWDKFLNMLMFPLSFEVRNFATFSYALSVTSFILFSYQVYIRSSDKDRCIMSAQTQLNGLYPPHGQQVKTHLQMSTVEPWLSGLDFLDFLTIQTISSGPVFS